MGSPRIIKDSQCDARPPAHFLDRGIGPGDTQVPPERPLRDPTPLLFVIQRHAVIKFSAEIYVTEAASVPSPVTISELAVRLEAAIDNYPNGCGTSRSKPRLQKILLFYPTEYFWTSSSTWLSTFSTDAAS